MANEDFKDLGFESFDDLGFEQESQQPVQEQTPSISKLESAARGAAQGGTLGFSDELVGALKSLPTALSGATMPVGIDEPESDLARWERLKDEYTRSRDLERAKNLAAKEANPKTYLSGEIAGGVATSFVPGMQAPSIPKAIKLGATLGAAQGLGSSEADLTEGEFGRAAVDTGVGGTIGGAAGLAGGLIGKGLEKLGGAREASQEAAARAAGLKGKYTKDMSPEQIREIGETLLEKDIIPFSGDAEEIAKRAEALRETSGKGIGNITEQFDTAGIPSYDPAQAASVIGQKARTQVMEEAQSRLESLLKMIRSSKEAPKGDVTNLQPKLTFKESQALKSKMGTEAFGKGGSQESKDVAKLVGGQLDEIYLNRAEQAAKEAGDETLVDLLKLLRKEYRAGLKGSEAAENLAKREIGTTPKLSAREAITTNLLPNDAKIALGLRKIAPLTEGKVGQALTGQTAQSGVRQGSVQLGKEVASKLGKKDQDRNLLTVNDLTKATPSELDELAEVLTLKGYPSYSEQLKKASSSEDPRQKEASLFQLQQQPSFRKAITGE